MSDTRHEWAGQAQCCVLATGWQQGLPFLQTWHDWRADPQRPGLLHVVCVLPWPQPEPCTAPPPHLQPLASQLAQAWWGLLPGQHRLSFDGGRVLLTLFVGPLAPALREMAFAADRIVLDAPGPAAPRDLGVLKALSRLSRRGARLHAPAPDEALRHDLRTCGFQIEHDTHAGVAADNALTARYAPTWTAKTTHAAPPAPGTALVIGAGLAGAAAAASLARRGWQVRVLDAADQPAAGASGLPAGLLAPHLTPDDNLLSRLARAGIRITLQQAQALLVEGVDWQGGGLLEHRLKAKGRKPAAPLAERIDAQGFAADWSRAASAAQREAAFLPDDALAVWHPRAAWIRPGALVRAWLAAPGIAWQGNARVARLEPQGGGWQAQDTAGTPLASADLVVLAAALGTAPLADGRLWLHPVRGQVSWGARAPAQALPPFPVNGLGHLLPDVPMDGQRVWMSGSSYDRGETDLAERAADHQANLERLQALIPVAAATLAPEFNAQRVQGWSGVRCASTDRRPLVGPLAPGLWVTTAMGSRGLTFAALCGELLAARLHGEPLPLPASLAPALDASRQLRT